jgi:flavodoxin
MSKTLVVYFSRTGNTKLIAESIYSALKGEKEIYSLGEFKNEDLEGYGLVFAGFPVHSHSIPFAVEEFMKKIPQGKKVALFSTHGSLTGGKLSREALEYAATLATKAKILGTFSCRGKVSPQALEVLEKSVEHKAWAEMAVSAATHPDKSDLEDATAFADWVMTLEAQS